MSSLYKSLKAFLAEPFTTPMSFWQYFALVGLTILIVVLWTFILSEITTGVKKLEG